MPEARFLECKFLSLPQQIWWDGRLGREAPENPEDPEDSEDSEDRERTHEEAVGQIDDGEQR